MTKEELKNVKYLTKEIERLRNRIEELEAAVMSVTAKNDGMPKGGGVSYLVEDLVDLKTMLNFKIWELETQKVRAERFVESITDSLTRMVIAHRYIDGLSWRQVAFHIGGGNTEESVKKIAYRFFNKS